MSTFGEYNIQFQPTASKRKRKKQIINDIKKQISFYFSDSNLSKDKFLRRLIHEDPDGYVAVDKIKSFSRITELNCSDKLLLKAMSLIPELTLDETKMKIKRISPIDDFYNADDRTIYIENLPQRMDHKRLERALSKYGTIMHVSLPRFKNNKEFKGFGFVEFSSVEEAATALKGLGYVNKDLPTEGKPDQQSKSESEPKPAQWPPILPDTEQEEEEEEEALAPLEMRNPPKYLNLSKSDPVTPKSDPATPSLTPDTPASETDMMKEAKEEQKKKRRRRRSSICISELKTPDVTYVKRDPLLLVTTKCDAQLPATVQVRKRKRTSLETVSPVTNKVRRLVSSCSESDTPRETSDVEMRKKLKLVKAKRRKKRKQKLKAKSELQDIRVFPKEEWMELKVVYKELQKQQISAIKKDLGMRKTDNSAIKLCGLPLAFSEDYIKELFKDAVVTVYKNTDHDAYVRFTTNPESYKTADLPTNISVKQLTDSEHQQLNVRLNVARQERYLETKRKRKLRGYAKVIKRCSAQDQTSLENV